MRAAYTSDGVFLFLLLFIPVRSFSQTIPQPYKVVICILENHSYQQIIGSPHAPYINSLADTGASFTDYHGLGYPSQPNYIKLFSGNDQGVINDSPPPVTPFMTPNLASLLIDSGFTFKGYSEDLPWPGADVWASGDYVREHTPWVNWQGDTAVDYLMDSLLSRPFTDFPIDYNDLPDLCFVIPNTAHDMHNGIDPGRIIAGDNWIQTYLDSYISWCQSHNSIFILTFDEDDNVSQLRVPLIIVGEPVLKGTYTNYHDHYGLLRTLEDMFSLGYIDNDSTAAVINECWQPVSVNDIAAGNSIISVYPNPITSGAEIVISNIIFKGKLELAITDMVGKKVKNDFFEIKKSSTCIHFVRGNLQQGVYFISLFAEGHLISTRKIVMN